MKIGNLDNVVAEGRQVSHRKDHDFK